MRTYPATIVGLEPMGTSEYVAGNVAPGDLLRLRREPGNRHDPKAVQALHRGRVIGYVARRCAWVSQSIDEGDSHQVEVVDIEEDADGLPIAVDVDITVTADGDRRRSGPPNITVVAPPLPEDAAPKPKKSRNYRLLLLAPFALFAYYMATYEMPQTGVEICHRGRAEFGTVMSSWRDNGTIVDSSLGELVVEDAKWATAVHDGKVSMAIAHFCTVNRDGRGHTLVKARRSGKVLASVLDGNYFDD